MQCRQRSKTTREWALSVWKAMGCVQQVCPPARRVSPTRTRAPPHRTPPPVGDSGSDAWVMASSVVLAWLTTPVGLFGWGHGVAASSPWGVPSGNQARAPLAASCTATENLPQLESVPDARLAEVQAIASDVDGTLTNPDREVPARTQNAIQALIKHKLFFPATGKTRAGMYNVLGEAGRALKQANAPGVFIQGLIVYADSSDTPIFERLLDQDIVGSVVAFCRERSISLIAYSGDRILCDQPDEETDKICLYHEPTPEAVGPLDQSGLVIHKLILMDTAENITRVRPHVRKLVGETATLTQAMDDMLEVLPPGASKGDGFRKLCQHLGLEERQVLAMGDAENDIEMLRLAGLGVCVGNACQAVRDVADCVAPPNSQDGAATVLERLANLQS